MSARIGSASAAAPVAIRELPILVVDRGQARQVDDPLAVEAPLEIRVRSEADPDGRVVTVTMRTPGDDTDLAVGFLFAEALIDDATDVIGSSSPDEQTVVLTLRRTLPPAPARNFTVSGACGICGKASLDALAVAPRFPMAPPRAFLSAALAEGLPERLRAQQPAFARTGGIHAAGLFDAAGLSLCAREDVGRHNAVDKVIGACLRDGTLPAAETILAVSGRASFELVQKAIRAGITALVAVGAPSTLAVTLAREHGLTLLGFVRDGRFNVYAGAERIELGHARA